MTDAAETSVQNPGFLRRHGGKVALSMLVMGSFIWLLHKGALPVVPPSSSFSRVRWWTLGVYVAFWFLVVFIRGARWKLLLDPIHVMPMRRIVAVSFIGFAAIALLPARTGEAVRPVLIRKRGHLSGWAATGTIAAERIIDGLVLCALLLVGLWLSTPLSPLPDHIGNLPISPAIVPKSSYIAFAAFASAFSVMAIFYAKRTWAHRTTERIVGIVSPKFAHWLADKVEHVAAGLGFLRNTSQSAKFIGVTAVYWFANAVGNWFLAWGVGFDGLTLPQAMVASGVIALGILFPNAPGFFGAFQFALYAALALYFPTDQVTGVGGAYVLLVYSSQLLVTVASAGIGFLLEPTSFREGFETEPDAENLPDGAAGE